MVHSKSRGWLKKRFPVPPEIDRDYEARASQFQLGSYSIFHHGIVGGKSWNCGIIIMTVSCFRFLCFGFLMQIQYCAHFSFIALYVLGKCYFSYYLLFINGGAPYLYYLLQHDCTMNNRSLSPNSSHNQILQPAFQMLGIPKYLVLDLSWIELIKSTL